MRSAMRPRSRYLPVPKVYNAHRFGLNLSPFTSIFAMDAAAREHPAFVAAAPENQLDVE
jgi:maleylacetoacetate isomerase